LLLKRLDTRVGKTTAKIAHRHIRDDRRPSVLSTKLRQTLIAPQLLQLGLAQSAKPEKFNQVISERILAAT
jgi:hypothetical protein